MRHPASHVSLTPLCWKDSGSERPLARALKGSGVAVFAPKSIGRHDQTVIVGDSVTSDTTTMSKPSFHRTDAVVKTYLGRVEDIRCFTLFRPGREEQRAIVSDTHHRRDMRVPIGAHGRDPVHAFKCPRSRTSDASTSGD